MTYTATLTCGSCKATLRFENERPDWKTYDYRVEQADDCERSARFVTEHVGAQFPREAYVEEDNPALIAWKAAGQPPFVWHPGAWARVVELYVPSPYRYVDCPVCDWKIRAPAGDPGQAY